MKKAGILLGPDGNPVSEMNQGAVQYAPPIPAASHCTPNGYLANTPGQYALWYFIRCAHQAVLTVPTQITVTGDEDTSADLKKIAESIAKLYSVELSDMFSDEHWKRAKTEAESSKMPLHPKVTGFIDSGGQTNRHYERDPDSHGRTN